MVNAEIFALFNTKISMKGEDNMDKKIIEIFMLKETSNNKSSMGGGCCSSGCGCGSVQSLTMGELVERFYKKYDSVGKIKIYKLTGENKKEFILRLNKVFLDSGERLVVSEANLDFVLSKVTPLIAVNGNVISVKNYPDEEQLYNAIMTGKKIPTKSGCC
ncbi:hypothetical protein [Anaeromicrobium sediminis]|uniref:hypothetical protein n=1 Tax=Anaeromicrobium sediminis TaxID=1478221 RepID=UPI00159543A1|nr:hypothetical protein [Anaeromicrobium sediminis]